MRVRVWPSGFEGLDHLGGDTFSSGASAGMLANQFLTRIAKHLASGRIDLHVVPLQVEDRQGIGGGLKNTPILLFFLTKLLLGLHLCGDITDDGQCVRLAFVHERGTMYLGVERGAVFAQANWPGLYLVSPV